MEKTIGNMVKITGLWESKDKNGNIVLSGGNNKISRFMVLYNNFKKEDKEPDFYLYLAENAITEKKDNPASAETDKVEL